MRELDQQTAFDRVDHKFLWRVMDAFGLGRSFLKKGNDDVHRYILYNLKLTETCTLYILCVEPLACTIRGSQTIKGITLPRGEILKFRNTQMTQFCTWWTTKV